MKTTSRFISMLLSISLMMLPLSTTHAAMLGNDQLVNQTLQQSDRDAVLRLLQQEQVQAELISLGVSPRDVAQRVETMTHEELAQLQGQLDELPAGGDILGLIVLLFIVFIITDIIGATDIFPFVHPVR